MLKYIPDVADGIMFETRIKGSDLSVYLKENDYEKK